MVRRATRHRALRGPATGGVDPVRGAGHGGGNGVERSDEQRRWDERWATAEPGSAEPWIVERRHLLPASGRAVDLAGGLGRHARWLAAEGFDATLVDVSGVALSRAVVLADGDGVSLRTDRRDLSADGPPPGPWDAAIVVRYCDRALLGALGGVLADGGVAMVGLPTASNLTRHARPHRRHLLADGELASITRGLGGVEVVELFEGWTPEGAHEARALLRRS